MPGEFVNIVHKCRNFDTVRSALIVLNSSGDIAKLGERCVRIAEAGGSNPPISTTKVIFLPYLSYDLSALKGAASFSTGVLIIESSQYIILRFNYSRAAES